MGPLQEHLVLGGDSLEPDRCRSKSQRFVAHAYDDKTMIGEYSMMMAPVMDHIHNGIKTAMAAVVGVKSRADIFPYISP